MQATLPDGASAELRAAFAAAVAAARLSRSYYRGNLEVSIKADHTPVTEADVECEKAIKDIILAAFPEHGFYGEETGATRADAEYLWLVDPIDGTKGFVRQYPFFSTQIALMHEGRIVVGVSSAPLFRETAWAVRGGGAWLNERALRVSRVSEWADCTLSTGNLGTLARGPGWAKLGKMIAQVARNRGYGDFYHYHLLAAGKIDLVIESDVNILDIAALSLIVEEAGGRFTDLEGRPPALDTGSVLAGTVAMWNEARALL